MSFKKTWLWFLIAGALAGLIYLRHSTRPPVEPGRVLPGWRAAAVTAVELAPLGVRVERGGAAWQMVRPLAYPARREAIELALAVFERLEPATRITQGELAASRSDADKEFGFAAPQTTIVFYRGGTPTRLQIGKRTLPGNQVYVRVEGNPSVFVVDAAVLTLVPTSPAEWRETALLDLKSLAFDRVAVTNGLNLFVLQRSPTNGLWRLVHPIEARADSLKVERCLEELGKLQVTRFVSDESRADLDTLGLQPADLEIALSQGSNTPALLQFGKAPTNALDQVFARCAGRNTVVTVPKTIVELWGVPFNDFRDSHLLSFPPAVRAIEVCADETFTLVRRTNDSWEVENVPFPIDPDAAREGVSALADLRVAQYVKDFVPEKLLPASGLASPVRQYTLRSGPANVPQPTNAPVVSLHFGSTNQGLIYARRGDESSVYAVKLEDYHRLPASSWELRQRRLWTLSTNDLAGVTLRESGRTRRLLRHGPYSWSLAPGSQGIIEELAVDETVRQLVQASVSAWAAYNPPSLAPYGIADDAYQVTLNLKSGGEETIRFGAQAPSGEVYAAFRFGADQWVGEFPAWLYDYLRGCLTVPAQ